MQYNEYVKNVIKKEIKKGLKEQKPGEQIGV